MGLSSAGDELGCDELGVGVANVVEQRIALTFMRSICQHILDWGWWQCGGCENAPAGGRAGISTHPLSTPPTNSTHTHTPDKLRRQRLLKMKPLR